MTAHASVGMFILAAGNSPSSPHICWEGNDMETDLEPNIRFQIQRDPDWSTANR
jgi:hypothetical protein